MEDGIKGKKVTIPSVQALLDENLDHSPQAAPALRAAAVRGDEELFRLIFDHRGPMVCWGASPRGTLALERPRKRVRGRVGSSHLVRA